MKHEPSAPRQEEKLVPFEKHDAPQYVSPHQEVLTEPLLAPAAVNYEPPAYSGDYREQGWCAMITKLFIFHFLNALLGIGANLVVVAGVSISVGLIPLCCIGLLFFRLVIFMVLLFARMDVALYNFISPPREHVHISLPVQAAFVGREGHRLSPSLSFVSPLSLLATLYFVTIKFGLGLMSLFVFSLALACPVTVIAALIELKSNHDDRHTSVFSIALHDQINPPGLFVVCVVLFPISIALMHVAALLSRAATRFFCCERFSTYQYIYVAQCPESYQAETMVA